VLQNLENWAISSRLWQYLANTSIKRRSL